MRGARFWLSILLLSILPGHGAPLPLTAKDVSLMLRSGYSNASVTRELWQRHFVGALSVEDEALLAKSGASAELISEINRGAYSLSVEENANAQAALENQAAQRAAAVQQAQKASSQYEAQLIAERTAKAPVAKPDGSSIADAMKASLVKIDNAGLAPVSDEVMAKKKLIGLYYSAHWCGPCRKFTPQLVDYYNRVIRQQPDVEFVFVSADHSAREMENYMREANMPWPAVEYAKIDHSGLRKFAGNGIPCLVVVDQTGRVISNSFEGEKYLGPQKVLADLDTIFAQVAAKRVAAGGH